MTLGRERIFPFLGIFGILEDSKKIQSISALSLGLGGQQKAALCKTSSRHSGRGSQEKGTVLLASIAASHPEPLPWESLRHLCSMRIFQPL